MSEITPPRVEGQEWCDEETLRAVDAGRWDVNKWEAGIRFELKGWGQVYSEMRDPSTARRLVACAHALAGTELPDNIELGTITRELEGLKKSNCRLTAQIKVDRDVIDALERATDAARRLVERWEWYEQSNPDPATAGIGARVDELRESLSKLTSDC